MPRPTRGKKARDGPMRSTAPGETGSTVRNPMASRRCVTSSAYAVGSGSRSETPASSKVAMSDRVAAAASIRPMASTAPVPSPSRMSRSRRGRSPRCDEDDPVSRLRREVGGDEVVAHRGAQAVGDESGRAGDEAVEDDDATGQRAAEDDAGQHADLEPADAGQDVEAVGRVGAVHVERSLDDGDLVRELAVGAARAAARGLVRRAVGQGGDDGAGRRGVADAHVAGADDIGAGIGGFQGQRDARGHACLCLLAGHGRALRYVSRAGAHTHYAQVGVNGQRRGDPGVDDDQAHARAPSHDADGGAAREDVAHHLRRDLLGVGGDALGHHAVVGGGEDDRLAPQCRSFSAEDSGDPDGQLLQPAQAAGRLGELPLSKRGGVRRVAVGGGDAADHVLHAVRGLVAVAFASSAPDGPRSLEVEARLGLDALVLEGVLDHAHLRDQVGVVDQLLGAYLPVMMTCMVSGRRRRVSSTSSTGTQPKCMA